MVDRLAVLLDRFSVSAQVFNAGALCGINTLEAETGVGQLHLIRQGPLEVVYGATSLRIDEPSLLLEQAPLQRVARDGQLGIFAHEGFWAGMDTFRDWTDLNKRWDNGEAAWKVWKD